MARHYTTKDFFRKIQNALLARYFQGLGDLDFSALKKGKLDELFTGWLALPEAQRKTLLYSHDLTLVVLLPWQNQNIACLDLFAFVSSIFSLPRRRLIKSLTYVAVMK